MVRRKFTMTIEPFSCKIHKSLKFARGVVTGIIAHFQNEHDSDFSLYIYILVVYFSALEIASVIASPLYDAPCTNCRGIVAAVNTNQ